MASIKIKVLLDDSHLGEAASVSRELSVKGMTVETSIPEAGVVFGSAEETSIKQLRGVEGVSSVEPEETYQLPPISGNIPQ